MNVVDSVSRPCQPVDNTLELVPAAVIKGKSNPHFGADGYILVKGSIALVVGFKHFPAQSLIVLPGYVFPGDNNPIVPVLVPDVVVVGGQLIKTVPPGKPDVIVALLQGLVDHSSQESLDTFYVPLDLVPITELILQRAPFVCAQL